MFKTWMRRRNHHGNDAEQLLSAITISEFIFIKLLRVQGNLALLPAKSKSHTLKNMPLAPLKHDKSCKNVVSTLITTHIDLHFVPLCSSGPILFTPIPFLQEGSRSFWEHRIPQPPPFITSEPSVSNPKKRYRPLDMDKLLNWSVAQQSGDKEAIAKAGNPDPKLLNQLFGGPDEPLLMKQLIQVLQNPAADEETKEVALENFEMLIENMDNANNIGNMGFWPVINGQLKSDVPEPRRVLAASIVGTATQNNPESQQAFHDSNGMGELITMAQSELAEPRLKALFAITSYIRNFEPGYKQFDAANGWVLVDLNKEAPTKVLLRTLSLVSAILSTGLDAKKQELLHSANLVQLLAHVLHDGEAPGHASCIDKALGLVAQLHEQGFEFTESEVEQLAAGVDLIKHREDISGDDLVEAQKVVKK